MGSKPSVPADAPRHGPPRQAITILDPAEKASDILSLHGQDARRKRAEAKDKVALERFQQWQAAGIEELRAQHHEERDMLQAAHERKQEALYAECTGMLTQHELEDAMGTAPGLLAFRWAGTAGSQSMGRAPAAAEPTDILPQNREHRRLAQLSMYIADSDAGKNAGVKTGLEVMRALEQTHQAAVEELKQAQARTLQAATLKAKYEYTAKVLELEDKAAQRDEMNLDELWEDDHGPRNADEDDEDEDDASQITGLVMGQTPQATSRRGRLFCRCGR